MFPLPSLTPVPAGLLFSWGSAVPVSMVVALLVSGAGVLHAALSAQRRPRSPKVRRQDVIGVAPEAGRKSRSTIAA